MVMAWVVGGLGCTVVSLRQKHRSQPCLQCAAYRSTSSAGTCMMPAPPALHKSPLAACLVHCHLWHGSTCR